MHAYFTVVFLVSMQFKRFYLNIKSASLILALSER